MNVLTHEATAPDGTRFEIAGPEPKSFAVLIRDPWGWFVYRWTDTQYKAISAKIGAQRRAKSYWHDFAIVRAHLVEERRTA